jgi:5'-3' exonuclease
MSVNFSEKLLPGNNLLVVDALNLAFRWQHQGVTTFCDTYVATVKSLAKSYKAKNVIIAADKGSSQYRKQLYPEYKQNRKERFEKQTEAEKQQFEEFFQEFEHTLDTLAEMYPVLRFQGVEADDIAAYVVSQQKYLSTEHTWLISSDKDWDLLVNPSASRFSYVTRKEVTWENWHDNYEFSTEDYISIKCLTGDSGDNVPGVPGIGPKRAFDLVREYGSTWDIIANLPILGKKHKYIQALNESKQQLELNYQLMDLVTHCREAIGTTNLNTINTTLELLK